MPQRYARPTPDLDRVIRLVLKMTTNVRIEHLATLMRRAYRRPPTEDDFTGPTRLFREARQHADFEAGIEAAIGAVLVNPHFLFRIERDPPDLAPQTALSNQRLGVGVAAVVLPVEQHAGR